MKAKYHTYGTTYNWTTNKAEALRWGKKTQAIVSKEVDGKEIEIANFKKD